MAELTECRERYPSRQPTQEANTPLLPSKPRPCTLHRGNPPAIARPRERGGEGVRKATLLQRKLRVPFLFNCQSLTDKGREEDIGGKGLSLSLCRGRGNERLSVSLSRATEWNTNSENPQRNREEAKGGEESASPRLLLRTLLCSRSNGAAWHHWHLSGVIREIVDDSVMALDIKHKLSF